MFKKKEVISKKELKNWLNSSIEAASIQNQQICNYTDINTDLAKKTIAQNEARIDELKEIKKHFNID